MATCIGKGGSGLQRLRQRRRDILEKETNTMGQEESTMGQEESTMGQEESTMGQEESTMGQEESTMGQEESTMGQEESTMGPEESTMGQEESTMGTSGEPQEQGTHKATCSTPTALRLPVRFFFNSQSEDQSQVQLQCPPSSRLQNKKLGDK